MANQTKSLPFTWPSTTRRTPLRGAMKVRDAGYQNWDCHTPYAMHGMDEAMGLKPTRIGFISFIFGMLGVGTAVVHDAVHERLSTSTS